MQPCYSEENSDARPLCVALLFGGMSSEHEVSRVSAGTFVDNMDPDKYELIKIGITKDGRWLYTEASSTQMADGSWEELPGNMPCSISPDRARPRRHPVYPRRPRGEAPHRRGHPRPPRSVGRGRAPSRACWSWPASPMWAAAFWPVRCAWTKQWPMPCSLPTTFPTAPGCLHQGTAGSRPEGIYSALEAKLGWPIFCKAGQRRLQRGHQQGRQPGPAGRRHQVGPAERPQGGLRVLVDGQEVECAVIGSEPAVATPPAPARSWPAPSFYTYDDKYKNGVSETLIPARLSEEKLDEVKDYAAKALHRCGLRGPGPVRLFRGAGHRPGADQRDQHPSRLYLY